MNKQKINVLLDLLICITIVAAIYSHTINRPWVFYDENAIYEETAVPLPSSFNEIIEIIKNFGTSYSFTSGNFLHSSNNVYRKINLGAPYLLLINNLLKKSAVFWHLANLFFHLVNVIIVYLILNNYISKNSLSKRILTITLTLIWALHPAQTESILLSSNLGATICYSICLLIFYSFINQLERTNSLSKFFVYFVMFTITALMLYEYIIVLPLLLFIYSFLKLYLKYDIKSSLIKSIWKTLPFILGLFIYLIFLFFTSNHKFIQQSSSNLPFLTFERIFWLSPQIIIHYLKLIFSPKLLSIDQSGHVQFGGLLFDSYPVMCFFILMLLLLVPTIIFLRTKRWYSLTLITWLTFTSLIPVSQILSPTYCLAAERYLYLPLFFIIFGIRGILNNSTLITNKKTTILISSLLIILILVFGTKTYIRTNDWSNNKTFISSLIKTSPNLLYKGFRYNDLYTLEKDPSKQEKYLQKALGYYSSYIKELKKTKNNNGSKILKSYGLDTNSLLIKAIYLKNYLRFTTNDKTYTECLNELEPFLQHKDQLDAKVLELYANLLIKKGDLKTGKDIFLYAHNKYPTNPFILVSLIRFERDIEKDLNATKFYLDKARKLYPYSKDILFEALRYYQTSNNLQEYSKHSYLYGLRAHSSFAYHEALTGFLMLNDLKNAKKTLDKLFILDPQDPKTHYLASGYYLKKGDYFTTKEELNKALLFGKGSSIEDKELIVKINNSITSLNNLLGNQ